MARKVDKTKWSKYSADLKERASLVKLEVETGNIHAAVSELRDLISLMEGISVDKELTQKQRENLIGRCEKISLAAVKHMGEVIVSNLEKNPEIAKMQLQDFSSYVTSILQKDGVLPGVRGDIGQVLGEVRTDFIKANEKPSMVSKIADKLKPKTKPSNEEAHKPDKESRLSMLKAKVKKVFGKHSKKVVEAESSQEKETGKDIPTR